LGVSRTTLLDNLTRVRWVSVEEDTILNLNADRYKWEEREEVIRVAHVHDIQK
jgi:hypothetical protein